MNDRDIEQLFSLRNEYRGLRYDLANVRALCEALGDPHRRFRSVLIAGTNGKGTVARWLSGMVPGSGLFTSPHLTRLNERISIGGREIDDDQLQHVHDDVRQAAKEAAPDLLYPPTYFELVTAMAFHYFRGRTDYAVVEVGLGGRLDATNILDQDVSVITSIGLDHCEHLGTTLDEIAAEKAGIIKTFEPVVVGARCDFGAIRNRAGDRIVDAGRLRPTAVSLGEGFFEVGLTTRVRSYAGLRPRLAGRHQVENLAVAVSAAEALEARDWPIDPRSIRSGINQTDWPGRLETFDGELPFIVDGGHNVDAVRAVREYLAEFHPGGVTLIFGAMVEKDYAGMLNLLSGHARRIILTRPANSRAADPSQLLTLVPSAIAIADVAAAIDYARRFFPDDPVLVSGSLYLAGETRAVLAGASLKETAR